ncbi:hypothetical protein pb186bvf_003864 [Paramecium bursaria]
MNTCSICEIKQSFYKNPNCFHTYCYKCIGKVHLPNKETIKCLKLGCQQLLFLDHLDNCYIQQVLKQINTDFRVSKIQQSGIVPQPRPPDQDVDEDPYDILQTMKYCGYCYMVIDQSQIMDIQKLCQYHKLCLGCALDHLNQKPICNICSKFVFKI